MQNRSTGKWKKPLTLKSTVAILVITVTCSAFYSAVAANEESAGPSTSGWNIPFSDLGSNELNYSYSMNYVAGGLFAMDDKANAELLESAGKEATEAMKSVTNECSSESGLGGVQARDIADAQKQASVGLDLNKVFQYGKDQGCFNALMDFPDLSVTIPSYTDIMNKVKDALIKYATRKVCGAVNETLEEAVNPIKDKLEEVSDRGQLDLNGQVNKEITKKMYDMDTELGRQKINTKPSQDIKIEW